MHKPSILYGVEYIAHCEQSTKSISLVIHQSTTVLNSKRLCHCLTLVTLEIPLTKNCRIPQFGSSLIWLISYLGLPQNITPSTRYHLNEHRPRISWRRHVSMRPISWLINIFNYPTPIICWLIPNLFLAFTVYSHDVLMIFSYLHTPGLAKIVSDPYFYTGIYLKHVPRAEHVASAYPGLPCRNQT